MEEKHTNKKKNQYQILVIICVLLAIFYTYCFYIALRLHNHFKIYFNGLITILWAFCAVVWYLLLKKINKAGKDNQL